MWSDLLFKTKDTRGIGKATRGSLTAHTGGDGVWTRLVPKEVVNVDRSADWESAGYFSSCGSVPTAVHGLDDRLGDRGGRSFWVESPWGALRNHVASSRLAPDIPSLAEQVGMPGKMASADENWSVSTLNRAYPFSSVDN